eukprot:TRINITY_DN57191_c0_g1_i1.p1 TRINITY_DN57191_c0_g1~~TRINITY_DN57191_c0_g1_i1.p1  ORF type:complete len:942 (-),score=179.82 TRINITY_DN57191_c0_g1_i1:23-2848(-)
MRIFSQSKNRDDQGKHRAETPDKTSSEGAALNRFKLAGVAVLILLRLRSDGVRRRSTREMTRLSMQFDKEQSKELQAIQGEVLNSRILMLRSAAAQACLSQVIPDPQSVGLAATALHAVKLYTIRTCYINHIRPWEQREDRLQIENESLRKQFRECRMSYLKEIAMLRDQVRARPDPDAGLPAFDITSYWSPEQMLTGEELEFLQNVITEKLKMIFDTNPLVSKTVDFGQVQKLKDRVENAEISALKQQLRETKETARKSREKRVDLDHLGDMAAWNPSKSATMEPGDNVSSDDASAPRHDNHEDLESALKVECSRTKQLGRSLEAAKLELDEMRSDLEDRLKETRAELESQLQATLARLDEQVRMHTSSLEELDKAKLDLVHASAANSVLQRDLDKSKGALEEHAKANAAAKAAAKLKQAARQARRASGITMTACFDCGATSPEECSCNELAAEFVSPVLVDACVGTAALPENHSCNVVDTKSLKSAVQLGVGAESNESVVGALPGNTQELDDTDVMRLKRVVQHQHELLQALLRAGPSEEEESRSGQPRGRLLSQASALSDSLCNCGRLLRPEACDVCGQTQVVDSESEAKARRTVEDLTAKIDSSEREMASIQEKLESELASAESRDAEQPERVVRLRQRLLGLIQEKGNLEAQLVIANFVLMSMSAKPSSKDACCDCHQELQALRNLSSDLAFKLEQATEENRQKQSSMNDFQTSVQEIASMISVEAPQLDGCMGKLQQLHEMCVFDRLRSHSKQPSFIKKLSRMQRILDESRAICAQTCVLINRPRGPSQVTWSFAKPRLEDSAPTNLAPANKFFKAVEVTGLGMPQALAPPPPPVSSRSFPASPRKGRLQLPTLATADPGRATALAALQLEVVNRNHDNAPAELVAPVSPPQTAMLPSMPQSSKGFTGFRSMASRSGRGLASPRGSGSFDRKVSR